MEYSTAILHHSTTNSTHSTAILLFSTLFLQPIPLIGVEWSGVMWSVVWCGVVWCGVVWCGV